MNSVFKFSFDNSRDEFCRKYKFTLSFKDSKHYEKALDWLQEGIDLNEYLDDMSRYGFHDVDYNPSKEFYGFESGNIAPKNYIKVMELWKEFFEEYGLDCGDIEEIINEKAVY